MQRPGSPDDLYKREDVTAGDDGHEVVSMSERQTECAERRSLRIECQTPGWTFPVLESLSLLMSAVLIRLT